MMNMLLKGSFYSNAAKILFNPKVLFIMKKSIHIKNNFVRIITLLWIPILVFLLSSFGAGPVTPPNKPRSVYMDSKGVVRWADNKQEVALFGANYSLPYGCDYRAAGYVGSDRKKLVEQDMAHFARMGWKGMRLCLWGDFEITDKDGNLVQNDHLDLTDYSIAKAKERGIYILLSPICTYSSLFPEAMGDVKSIDGFSTHYRKEELGTNPQAIAAQVNYIKQLLQHVNPYTGIALKDEPSIIFIEPINEPVENSDDPKGTIKYINTLADAVRSTGCKKLLFYNVSQNMKMASIIPQANYDGVSFAWYPTGLNSGKTISANVLRAVDDYPPMHTSELSNMAKIVYEFDAPDTYNPYMYPAMARAFRSVGTQFASMFSYDMISTASYNLGWQTHWLNMVYTPQKAIGAIIAGEVIETLPRGQTYGKYPENTSFGPFRVSYEENLSEMVTNDKFIYANNTKTVPQSVSALKQIVGFGSSPLIGYEGQGLYFLDKIDIGMWRLEIYPDVKIVSDPFAQGSKDKVVSRLVSREWLMNVNLPYLGNTFYITPLNKGNNYSTVANLSKFKIKPGVYLLSVKQNIDKSNLPETVGRIGLTEFECPQTTNLPIDLNLDQKKEYVAGEAIKITAEIIDSVNVDQVYLYIKDIKSFRFERVPMAYTNGYTYEAVLSTRWSSPGKYEYCIEVVKDKISSVFPSRTHKSPSSWDFYEKNMWGFNVIEAETPLRLFLPQEDVNDLAFTRIGDNIRWGIYKLLPSDQDENLVIRLFFPQSMDKTLDDYTMSLVVKDRIKARGENMKKAASILVKARSENEGREMFISLMESDGTTWSKKIAVTKEWKDYIIPIKDFLPSKGVLLPLSYPERWDYWVDPAKGRGLAGDYLQMNKVERLQISLRPNNTNPTTDESIEVSDVLVQFKN
jgi:hypothetical protein